MKLPNASCVIQNEIIKIVYRYKPFLLDNPEFVKYAVINNIHRTKIWELSYSSTNNETFGYLFKNFAAKPFRETVCGAIVFLLSPITTLGVFNKCVRLWLTDYHDYINSRYEGISFFLQMYVKLMKKDAPYQSVTH